MSNASVKLTHPDRVIDAESGATKGDAMVYYTAVERLILPHIKGRLLAMLRCPVDVSGECFFQKHLPKGKHEGISSHLVRTDHGPEEFFAIEEPIGLLDLCQFNAIELHPWGSRVEDIEKPDLLVFDLDPDPSIDWDTTRSAAVTVLEAATGLGLHGFLKLTGGKGVHVVCPIKPELEWDPFKELARTFADQLQTGHPGLFVTNIRKSARKDRIFVDYLRNGRGATAISPYSLRARPGLPVAMPITPGDLEAFAKSPAFDHRTALEWIGKRKSDPWLEMDAAAVSLKQILKI